MKNTILLFRSIFTYNLLATGKGHGAKGMEPEVRSQKPELSIRMRWGRKLFKSVKSR
jgi:hypothetical protein